MTTSIRENVRSRAARAAPEEELPTLAGLFVARLRAQREAATRLVWPSMRYLDNPVGFFEDVLGIIPWSRQRELLGAVAKYRRVACKSGRRTAKSNSAAGLALWWYCARPQAQAVLSSTTARQVDAILWREMQMLRTQSGRCISCIVDDVGHRGPRPCTHSALIDGEIGLLARTGLKSIDEHFRIVWGFTAREAEAVQGIAGRALFFILDESSGIPEPIFDAVEGNLAGGGRSLYLGNPTKTSGRFFDAFGKNKLDEKDPTSTGIYAMTIASTESPNVDRRAREDVAARIEKIGTPHAIERARQIRACTMDVNGLPGSDVVPGLATKDWIREREKEWGKESPLFRVHVDGEYATNEDGKIFSIDRIEQAKERHVAPATKAELAEALARGLRPATLFLGVDPAGETGTGDESAFTPRRALCAEPTITARGLNDERHLAKILEILEARMLPREVAVVVVDRTGSIGAELFGRLVAYCNERERERLPPLFHLVGVKFSDKAQRQPERYDTMRDEIYANLEIAFREGAAIPEDVKLEAELHVMEWRSDVKGRSKVTPKDEIKRALGRSPDRCDSLALAFWEDKSLAAKDYTPAAPSRREHDDEDDDSTTDPWEAERAWRR